MWVMINSLSIRTSKIRTKKSGSLFFASLLIFTCTTVGWINWTLYLVDSEHYLCWKCWIWHTIIWTKKRFPEISLCWVRIEITGSIWSYSLRLRVTLLAFFPAETLRALYLGDNDFQFIPPQIGLLKNLQIVSRCLKSFIPRIKIFEYRSRKVAGNTAEKFIRSKTTNNLTSFFKSDYSIIIIL